MPWYLSYLVAIAVLSAVVSHGGASSVLISEGASESAAPTEVAGSSVITTESATLRQLSGGVTVEQQDVDQDGLPDVSIITTSFYSRNDRIVVVDGAQNMVWANDPYQATDFFDDTWIFDANSDGTAQLIIRFGREGRRYSALLYDDMDGDRQVRYRLVQEQVIIEESKFWHVKVESERPWAEWDTQFGADLTFFIDGFNALGLIAGGGPWARAIGTDGVVDWEIDIGDLDEDGISDYQLKRAISPALKGLSLSALHKTGITVQARDQAPARHPQTVLWPLLIGELDYENYRYFDYPPAIAVDWQAGAIDQIGILGYPVEAGYHISDRLPLEKHAVNVADFENPMAYYDMAHDEDGWPELQLRFSQAIANDPYFPEFPYTGLVGTPNLEVCYSWDQDNDNRWDYKIDLGGNVPIEEVVEFPDFSVKSVPYEQLVPWVRNRTWDVAMLIFDDRPSPDSEGMFGKGWHINRGYAEGEMVEPSGVSTEYLTGLIVHPPEENYQEIQDGMRGEYSFRYFDAPKVYLSSLDHQLHLFAAQAGVWNLGQGRIIRYANLDGDAYLDQWQEQRDGVLLQQLNYASGIYVYSGSGVVRLKQSSVNPSLVDSQPPGDYDEWQRLEGHLKANRSTLQAADLAGMLGQLGGAELQIDGATIHDFRVTPKGFRFILELLPGVQILTDEMGLSQSLAAAMVLVVEHDGQELSVRPAAPTSLRAVDLRIKTEDGTARVLEWTTVQAAVRNDGSVDVHSLPVCATFYGPADRRLVITETLSLVPGNGVQSITWDWAPPVSGSWNVHVVPGCGAFENGTGAPELAAETSVQVHGGPAPSVSWLITVGGLVPGGIVLFLLGAGGMAGVVAAIWVRASDSTG